MTVTKSRRWSLAFAALAAWSLALAGCGKQTLVAGILAGLPAVTYQPPDPAPGVHLDPQTIGPYTLLTGLAFQVDISDPTKIQDANPTGVDDARASINYRSCKGLTGATLTDCQSGTGGIDHVFAISGQGSGLYLLKNSDLPSSGPQFEYEPGVKYTMVLEVPTQVECPNGLAKCAAADETVKESEAYGTSFKPGPKAVLKEFCKVAATSAGCAPENKVSIKQAKGTGLTLNRLDVLPDGTYLPALVLVAPIDTSSSDLSKALDPSKVKFYGPDPAVPFDFKDPKQMVKLALSDQPFRKGRFDLPTDAFPTAGTFLVALLSITEGKASANAFIGSTSLALSGDTGLVETK